MRYWYDTEFIEDGRTIDLISIGVVAEDGREFYAESIDADHSKASDWVKENVLRHLQFAPHEQLMNWRIRDLLLEFCDVGKYGHPEFWGYYSAYDHVVLCQLFGTMMQLPTAWPNYTCDIKQWCDQLGNPRLPEQGKNEHHALADARWNRQAWEYLYSISMQGYMIGAGT